MSLYYILDGYNVIKTDDALADLSLEQGRNALIRLINVNRPQGSARNQVAVVFDGKDDVWGPQPGGVAKVIFTSGETADDRIKRLVEEAQDKKNIVVVTNDGEVACYVRKLGARTQSVRHFLAAAPRGRRVLKAAPGKGGRADRRKSIARETEHRINKEMEEIWLKKRDRNQG